MALGGVMSTGYPVWSEPQKPRPPSGMTPGPTAPPRHRRPRPAGGGTRHRDVKTGSGVDDRHLFGVHAVRAALLNPDRSCRRLLCTEAAEGRAAEIVAEARALRLDRPAPQVIDRARLERLVPPGAVHQGLVAEVGPLPPTDLDDIGRAASLRDDAAVVALDQVTDPHNVGAVMRSAAAFGALAVLVTDRHAPVVTGTLARSASGAADHVPLVRVVNLARALEQLKGWGFTCIGLDERAEADLAAAAAPAAKIALVLGAEGSGLRRKTRDTCDRLARLPTTGAIASLNVSNAAAVGLYDWVSRRPRSGGGGR